ncbi:DNA mismatch repair protein Msh6 [Wallemia mellicola]|nr:DNA mismatch repair protein Msh6 [Wallemia mellicola]TIB90155.1 DNA mismatch repair protein Msh6 [Wallemia mellicola]TIC36204.1 DNA mismatch repair protein Msh6 [Wallemia mellicola]TIC41990.1 DNA mismatch repair protein Msh6 [Wallemia mellicola]TIC50577.1 DNA mismatch repair protein Msh6 [Wallemia mellicola]
MPPKTPGSSQSLKQGNLFSAGFFKKTPTSAGPGSSSPAAPSTATKKRDAIKPSNSSPLAPQSTDKQPNKQKSAPMSPLKEMADDDSDDDEENQQPKRQLKKRKPMVISSDEEEPQPAKRKLKKRKESNDDDFIDDGPIEMDEDIKDAPVEEESDDLIEEIDLEDIEKSKQAPKPKPAPKETPAKAARPSAAGLTPSGGNKSLLTKAERQVQQTKAAKKDAESPFMFLHPPYDKYQNPIGHPDYDPHTLHIPPKYWKEFSPFEKQFWEIKADHFDTILFFQKGKFYELYENDAIIGHREFDLKLTERVRMCMVGVPEMSFDFFAAKFLALGYKVGKVEQRETAIGMDMRQRADKKPAGGAKAGKSDDKLVRRELRSVLTNGTLVDPKMLADEAASHCVSIKETSSSINGNKPTFGLCILDASTGEFNLATFEDDKSRSKLETLIRQLRPKEIVHEKGNLDQLTLRVLRNITSISCLWTSLNSGKEGMDAIETITELKNLFNKDNEDADKVKLPDAIESLIENTEAIESLGNLMWYLRSLNLDRDLLSLGNFNIYDATREGQAMILDGRTLAHIEVLVNSEGGEDDTLLKLLNRCTTPFGKRLFRIWLCTPLRSSKAINERLNAVDDVISNTGFTQEFDSNVKGLPDLERLLSRIHAMSVRPKQFLQVLEAFNRLQQVFEKLEEEASEFKSQSLKATLKSIPDLREYISNIESKFDLTENDTLMPCDGADEAYEDAKKLNEDLEQELDEILERYKREFKIKTISYKDVGTKEIYSIEMPKKTSVPANWAKLSSTQKVDRYWSPEVRQLVQKVKEARETRASALNDFAKKLYVAFDEDYKTWIAAVKACAEIDCINSLAKSSINMEEPRCRPTIIEADEAIIDFDQLRHPSMALRRDFVANDVKLGGNDEGTMLLTGPNMAGKSTLLRMTAAAVIMAQIGCYVPAQSATIAPVDRIASRLGAYDNMFSNSSTFMVELAETSKIVNETTPKSLLILDELGRGTSTTQGIAIASAVLQHIASFLGCCLFSTHYSSLGDFGSTHPNIKACHMASEVNSEKREIRFLYKLVEGVALDSYGHHVAKLAGVPLPVVVRAEQVATEYTEANKLEQEKAEAKRHKTIPLAAQSDFATMIRLARQGANELTFRDKRNLRFISEANKVN